MVIKRLYLYVKTYPESSLLFVLALLVFFAIVFWLIPEAVRDWK